MHSDTQNHIETAIIPATNEVKTKRTDLPRSIYIERMIEIVYYDVKFHNKTMNTFKELAQRVNESFEKDFFYTVPFIDTGKDYIRDYVRSKRNELLERYKRLEIDYNDDRKSNNTYDELIYFCKKDYVINYVKKNKFFDSFDFCEECTKIFPDAVLFVKRRCENLVSDFLLEHLDDIVKGTIIGNGCLQIYFHDYKSRVEFYELFFEDLNYETSESSNVDDIDDSDDKKEEIEKT